MMGCTAILESGSLRLVKDQPWHADFMNEYLAFPNGKYDDQMDALSQFLEWHRVREYQGTFSWDMGFDEEMPGVPAGEAILAMRPPRR
jgi:hypothetical protein